ncbi:MAG: PAS domain S-box protein [Syntrophobacteraceae bacterium]
MQDENKSKEELLIELRSLRAELFRSKAADRSYGRSWNPSPVGDGGVFYQAVVEDQAELITRYQPDGTLTFVNDAYCRFFGETRENLIGTVFWHHMPEIDQERLRAYLDSFSKEYATRTIEHRVLDFSGAVRWLQWTDLAFWDDSGKIAGFQAVGRDITDGKHAEKTLRESRARFRALFENAPLPYQSLDENGFLLEVNRKWLETLGYNRPEVIGHWFGEFLAEGFVDHFDRNFPMFKDACAIDGVEFDMVRKSGEIATVSFNGRVQLDDHGRFVCTHCIFVDITSHKLADEALEKSEATLKSIFRAAPIGIGLVADRILTEVNDGVCAMTGYSREELAGQNARILYPSHEEFEWVGRNKYMQISQRGTGTVETQWRTKDGAIIDVLLSSTPLDPTDHSAGVIFTALDISEQKRAEAALSESEELYRTLVSLSPDAISMADMSGLLTFASPKAMQMFGFSPEDEILGHPLFGWVVREEQEKASANLRHLLAGGTPTDTEYTLIRKDGARFIGEVNAAVTYSLDGSPTGTIFITRDITERKRSEESLRESEEQFKTMFEMASIGMAQTDPKSGQWLRVNQKMCEIVGYSPEEMLELRFADITHPEDHERDLEAMRNLLDGKSKSYRLEKRYIRKDGTTAWVNVNVTLLRDSAGQPMRTMATIEDITERKRAEEENAKLQEQLFQSQKMESIGRLAGGVAHDFNNMLGVILGHAEMALAQVDFSQPLHGALHEIRKAAERSANLTRQLLAFARKQTVAPRVLDLNETVQGMLQMLGRLIGEDIELVWVPESGLWQVKIDPSQIDQVLANLSVNARDAIAGVGNLTIQTQNVVFDERYCAEQAGFVLGEYVQLAVTDDGCGMNKETRDRLFEPFFTTKGVGKGTGLGLATVYGIVRQNNGFINVYSEPGLGTTFKIYLPRHKGKAEQLMNEGAAETHGGGSATILLVEDEPAILDMTRIMLERQGYTVLAASMPGEAIRLAEAHPGEIHLLMTDVVMPEMNGRDLAKNILPLYPNLKRLFMSGYTADVVAHHGVLDAGINFIQKPFTMKEIAKKVREILEQNLAG